MSVATKLRSPRFHSPPHPDLWRAEKLRKGLRVRRLAA
jgi:hypothetical protein